MNPYISAPKNPLYFSLFLLNYMLVNIIRFLNYMPVSILAVP